MGRNFDKTPVSERPTSRGSGSKWTGPKGTKFATSGMADGQREAQCEADRVLTKRSDGGLDTDPKKDNPVRNTERAYKTK